MHGSECAALNAVRIVNTIIVRGSECGAYRKYNYSARL